MIYLKLFITFLQIGAVSFGGGYGMISMIREKMLSYGWMSEEELLNMIAVAESTPGPIAVNMATFVGSAQGGLLGSILATLGIVLPSFIIILVIAAIVKNLLKYAGVKAFLIGIRPCVVGLIVATSAIMLLNSFFNITDITSAVIIDPGAIIIMAVIIAVAYLIKRTSKKKASPILMIMISASLGILVYGVLSL